MKTLSVKNGLSILMLASVWFSVSAEQRDTNCTGDSTGMTKIVVPHFTFGGFGAQVDDFNSVMTPNGYKRLKDYSYQFGFGCYSQYKRLIFNWDLIGTHWPSGNRKTNAILTANGINGIFDAGFNVVNGKIITLYPYLGVGFGQVFMSLGRKSVQLSEVISGDVNESRLWKRSMIIDAGLGLDLTHVMKYGYGFRHVTGLRVGYWFDLSESKEWYIDNSEIKNDPKLSMSGPYVRLIMGKSSLKRMCCHDCKK